MFTSAREHDGSGVERQGVEPRHLADAPVAPGHPFGCSRELGDRIVGDAIPSAQCGAGGKERLHIADVVGARVRQSQKRRTSRPHKKGREFVGKYEPRPDRRLGLPAAHDLGRRRQTREHARNGTTVRHGHAHRRPVADRHEHRSVGQPRARWWRMQRPVGNDGTRESDGDGSGRTVVELDHDDRARPGDRVYGGHEIATGHAHARLHDRHLVDERLTGTRVIGRVVNTILGDDPPVDRRAARRRD